MGDAPDTLMTSTKQTTNGDNQMTQVYEELGINQDELRDAIREEYNAVALTPDMDFHFHTGRKLAKMLNYEDSWLNNVPETVIDSFAGTGNPFSLGEILPGEHVVDIACGAGIDSFIAAHKVGETGRVVGVDMTSAMIIKAREALAQTNLTNLGFYEGYSEDLPVDDGWADVVILNGALNLMPDKDAVLREAARVLKPNGRLQMADILVQRPVSLGSKKKIDLWTGCIAGALMEDELHESVVKAGFVDFEITWRDEVFDGAPQASSAANFGTVGINFRARKTTDMNEWNDAMAAIHVPTVVEIRPQPMLNADSFYDAGDVGCAFGPIDEIASIVNNLESGQTLEVRATDTTVGIDLESWSQIVGHELVIEQGDRYLIRRK
jgi:arsenite methyltransferase